MANSIDVVLTLGFDHYYHRHKKYQGLHDYITQPVFDNQHLTMVCGDPDNSDDADLDGSGQAGSIRIYAGLLRRGSAREVTNYLEMAPWDGIQAVVVIHNEDGVVKMKQVGWNSPHIQSYRW